MEYFNLIQTYLPLYAWLSFTSFLNILMPVSGSSIVLPFVTFYTDPLRALGIINFVFFFSAIHRVYLFRKEIFQTENFFFTKRLIPFSVLGVVLGTFLLSQISPKFIIILFVLVSINFIYKNIKILLSPNISQNRKVNAHSSWGVFLVGFASGFAQAFGLGGAEIRTNYLRTKVSEVSARAIGFPIGLFSFLFSGLVLLLNNHLLSSDVYFVLSFIVFIIFAQHFGKKILGKIPDFYAKLISIVLSSIGITLIVYKYFS